jgi:hypothetical protein
VIIEILTVVSMLTYSQMMLSILVNIHQHPKEPVTVIFEHEDETLRHFCVNLLNYETKYIRRMNT